jgi:hypothetical protein
VRDLLNFEPQGRGTVIAQALDYLGRVSHRRSIVFLISDFIDSGYEKPLSIVARRHDLVSLTIADPREREIPNVGLISFEDAETGEIVLFDSSSAAARAEYAALGKSRIAQRRELFRQNGVDEIQVAAGEDYVRDLMLFFRRRERRR